MSEQDSMSCAEFHDSAAELALGVLTGRERAEALAHLDHCEACREHVRPLTLSGAQMLGPLPPDHGERSREPARQLTMTGEQMLGLLPTAEPPAGFETRVMDRLGLTVP